jgi:hypothetical protein
VGVYGVALDVAVLTTTKNQRRTGNRIKITSARSLLPLLRELVKYSDLDVKTPRYTEWDCTLS